MLVVVTVAAWAGRFHPWLELLPNARNQILLVAAIAATAWLVTGQRGPAAVAALVVAVHAAYLVPYVLATPDPEPTAAATVRAMQYNIFYNNDDLSAVAGHIIESDADVVAIHELLPEVWVTLEPQLDGEYPHRYAVPFDEHEGQLSGGMALLSKTPLSPVQVPDKFSPPDRVLLAATTEIDSQPITVIGLHPHASRFESRKVELRETQIEGVTELATGTDNAVMVLADMNVTPTSPMYQDLLTDLGWRDPHRVAGWDSTWPTWGGPLGFPIDHVLVSDHFAIHGAQTGNGAGSDHRSLTVDLSLR